MLRVAERRLTDTPRTVQLLRWASNRVVPDENAVQTAARRAFALTLKLTITRDLDLVRDLVRALDLTLALDLARDLTLDLARDLSLDLTLDLTLALTLARDRALTLDLTLALTRALDLDLDRPHALGLFKNYTENLLSLLDMLGSSQILLGTWNEASQQLKAIRDQPNEDSSAEEISRSWNQILDIFANVMHLPPELRAPEEAGESLDAYLYACQLIVDCKNAATRVSRSVWDDICQRILNPPEHSSSGGAHKKHQRKTRRT
ncbi:NACHT C-terminal helical domain 2-containing protein [Archangium sp.]|uniref:NACHT C-terminal helical domain 2-containing protein n=1 Tax=Archangium sp. TaxID=1872627 RepID=UPI002D4CA5D5|nr:hypothetical protein [Archangium sp.]HYO52482.1 hypothetical protein [Archangium sp.]